MAEITYLAQVLHWPLSALLDLEHADRQRFIELVAPDEGAGNSMPEGSW